MFGNWGDVISWPDSPVLSIVVRRSEALGTLPLFPLALFASLVEFLSLLHIVLLPALLLVLALRRLGLSDHLVAVVGSFGGFYHSRIAQVFLPCL